MNDLGFFKDRCKHHESDFFTGIQWGVQTCAWASTDTSGIALAFFLLLCFKSVAGLG